MLYSKNIMAENKLPIYSKVRSISTGRANQRNRYFKVLKIKENDENLILHSKEFINLAGETGLI
jgi:hypothetical protein